MTEVLAAPVGRDKTRVQASTAGTRNTLRMRLEVHPEVLAPIRAIVRAQLVRWDCEVLARTACVGVSELLTNVIQHVTSPLATLTVLRMPHGVMVSVADSSPDPPIVRCPGPFEQHGRGLYLLKNEAADWGVRRIPAGGKAIWFSLQEQQ